MSHTDTNLSTAELIILMQLVNISTKLVYVTQLQTYLAYIINFLNPDFALTSSYYVVFALEEQLRHT